MGYSLNQRGLYAGVIRDPNDRKKKLHEGACLPTDPFSVRPYTTHAPFPFPFFVDRTSILLHPVFTHGTCGGVNLPRGTRC